MLQFLFFVVVMFCFVLFFLSCLFVLIFVGFSFFFFSVWDDNFPLSLSFIIKQGLGSSNFVPGSSWDVFRLSWCKTLLKKVIYLFCILSEQYLNLCGALRITEIIEMKKNMFCCNLQGQNVSKEENMSHINTSGSFTTFLSHPCR